MPSLVGSEMCIRDRRWQGASDTEAAAALAAPAHHGGQPDQVDFRLDLRRQRLRHRRAAHRPLPPCLRVGPGGVGPRGRCARPPLAPGQEYAALVGGRVAKRAWPRREPVGARAQGTALGAWPPRILGVLRRLLLLLTRVRAAPSAAQAARDVHGCRERPVHQRRRRRRLAVRRNLATVLARESLLPHFIRVYVPKVLVTLITRFFLA